MILSYKQAFMYFSTIDLFFFSSYIYCKSHYAKSSFVYYYISTSAINIFFANS